MQTKLTKKELIEQYHYRASCVADLIGKLHGKRNRKITERVLKEPNQWTLWVIKLLRPLIPNSGKRRIRVTPWLPLFYLFSLFIVWWVRYIDRRGFTLKTAEAWCRGEVSRYLETDGQWVIDKVVDVEAVLKADPRIAKDPEYNKRDDKGKLVNLTARTQSTIATVLLGTPLDDQYPRFTAKTAQQPRWRHWLGLKPRDSFQRVLWKAFWKPFRATRRGDFTLVRDVNTHLTATGIAREQGYNKGRINSKTMSYLVNEGIVHKGITYIDDEGNTMAEIIDSKAGTCVNDTETRLFVEAAKLSPQEMLIVQAWQSGELPIPGKQRPHGAVRAFALENGLSYQAIRTIENRARRKLIEAYNKN